MFDLENLEGFKVSKDLGSYTSLIYGVPKIGKSTFAYKMFGKDCLFLAFEQGYKALAGVMKVDITKWADLYKLNKELKKDSVKNKFKVLVIDTIDILDKLAKDYILSTNGISDMGGLPYGKAYDLKDNLIFDMLKMWQDMGYGLLFISHSKEVATTINDVETTKFQPSVDKRTLGVVAKMCDIIAFAYLRNNKETQEEERVLYLRESLRIQAGSRFKYMLPIVKLDSQAFNEALSEAITKQEEENPDFMTETKTKAIIDTKLDFNSIMENIISLVKDKLAPNGKMDEVTRIVENHMGVGAKVTEATENQVQVCDIILTELQDLVDGLNL